MTPAIDDDGWLLDAKRRLSPNCDKRPANCDIDLAVLHGISLPPGEFGGDDILRLFENRLDCNARPSYDTLRGLRVSAHFLIIRTGDITQFVSCQKRAWHAGDSSWRGRQQCNDFSLGIELEGDNNTPYTAAQYEKLAALISAISVKRTPNLPSLPVTGHEHIAPGRKTDPGPYFDWEKLFQSIGKAHDGR